MTRYSRVPASDGDLAGHDMSGGSILSSDVHVQIKLWHLILLFVGLALWHTTGAGMPGPAMAASDAGRAAKTSQARRVPYAVAVSSPVVADSNPAPLAEQLQRAESVSAPPFVSTQPLPPNPPPMPAGTLGAVRRAPTEALIGELHGRQYDWEVLERAGLRFSGVRHLELLTYLRRDAPRFREILSNTSLGLGVVGTTQLLRALSRRADLAAALRETGLGAGSDFHCATRARPRPTAFVHRHVIRSLSLPPRCAQRLMVGLAPSRRRLRRVPARRRLPDALQRPQLHARAGKVPLARPLRLARREQGPLVGHPQVAAGVHAAAARNVRRLRL